MRLSGVGCYILQVDERIDVILIQFNTSTTNNRRPSFCSRCSTSQVRLCIYTVLLIPRHAISSQFLNRYFWEHIIDIFGQSLNTSAAVFDDQSVSFSLEIVLALRRLVDSEMVRFVALC